MFHAASGFLDDLWTLLDPLYILNAVKHCRRESRPPSADTHTTG